MLIDEMSEPLVSVCIGTFNREKYIRECIDSVFAQTYKNMEVIIVDDASTDKTPEIVMSYAPRVNLIRRTVNSGMCQITRNQATKEASGRYIAYLDSDDAWYPTKIEQQVEFLEAHPSILLCHTYCEILDEHSKVLGVRHENHLPPTGRCFAALVDRCWITISSVMLRASVFDKVGYFNEDRFFRIGEDYEFFLRVAQANEIGLIPQVLAKYRKSNAGITSGPWKYVPRALPMHQWLLKNTDLWHGHVERSEVSQAVTTASIENSQYWREKRFPGRALWSLYIGLKADPLNPALIEEMLKVVLSGFGVRSR